VGDNAPALQAAIEISIRGNEMRGAVFPFENALYDEITGSIVPQRIFTKLTVK
jgi:hypothetical protein